MRRLGIPFVVTALGAALAAPAAAQTVQVQEGGRPVVGATVSTLINGIKTPRGVTGEDGRVAVPEVEIAEGTRVDVYRRACVDGTIEIVLAPEGEGDGCAGEGAAAGEDCECEKAGAIVWGGPDPIVVDLSPVGPPTEILRGPGTMAPAVPSRPRVKLEAGIGYHQYGQIEEQACAGAGACTTDESAIAPFVQFELRPWPDVPVVLGGSFDWASGLETAQNFDGISNEVDLDIYTLGGAIGWDLVSAEGLILSVFVGMAQAWNRAIARTLLGGQVTSEDRNESGLRVQGGAALEYGFGGSWYGLVGYRYLTGGGDDADTHHALRVGVGFGGGF